MQCARTICIRERRLFNPFAGVFGLKITLAESPLNAYSNRLTQISSKLKRGREMVKRLVENSSSLSEELYLIELDGGQKRLMSKNTRQTILDEYHLREIKRTIEAQIVEAEQSKLKPWMVRY